MNVRVMHNFVMLPPLPGLKHTDTHRHGKMRATSVTVVLVESQLSVFAMKNP
jgi:hypothetical protein